MMTILLIVHLILCVALTGLILLQRSEGGGLGMGGGGGGGPGSLLSGRSAANVLTRSTTILGALFFASSLGLTLLANAGRQDETRSIVEQAPADAPLPAPALPSGPVTLPGAPAAGGAAIPEPAAAPAAPPAEQAAP